MQIVQISSSLVEPLDGATIGIVPIVLSVFLCAVCVCLNSTQLCMWFLSVAFKKNKPDSSNAVCTFNQFNFTDFFSSLSLLLGNKWTLGTL